MQSRLAGPISESVDREPAGLAQERPSATPRLPIIVVSALLTVGSPVRLPCWTGARLCRVSCLRLVVETGTMSDEVSNFLRSVEQLKDRRLEEDEARSRELEEKILQEKRERQARRAGATTLRPPSPLAAERSC